MMMVLPHTSSCFSGGGVTKTRPDKEPNNKACPLGDSGARRPKRRFYRDEGALEDMPLRLIITALILATTVPAATYGIYNYSKTSADMAVSGELARIALAAKQASGGGNGTALSVSVEFKSGVFSNIEYIKIGDRQNGTYAGVMRYKFTGEAEKLYVSSYDLRLVSEGNSTLSLGQGSHTLQVIHVLASGADYVLVKELN